MNKFKKKLIIGTLTLALLGATGATIKIPNTNADSNPFITNLANAINQEDNQEDQKVNQIQKEMNQTSSLYTKEKLTFQLENVTEEGEDHPALDRVEDLLATSKDMDTALYINGKGKYNYLTRQQQKAFLNDLKLNAHGFWSHMENLPDAGGHYGYAPTFTSTPTYAEMTNAIPIIYKYSKISVKNYRHKKSRKITAKLHVKRNKRKSVKYRKHKGLHKKYHKSRNTRKNIKRTKRFYKDRKNRKHRQLKNKVNKIKRALKSRKARHNRSYRTHLQRQLSDYRILYSD